MKAEAAATWSVTVSLTAEEAAAFVEQLDSGYYQGGTVGAVRNQIVVALRATHPEDERDVARAAAYRFEEALAQARETG